jgi:hypothetical protein
MDDKLDMTISLKVKGKEGLNVTLEYLGTDMKTVRMVEDALIRVIAGLNAVQGSKK